MHKYLVVSDLDDTLLTKKKTIRNKTVRFVKKFVKKGNYFVICTGRPFAGAINFYKRLGVNMPLITDNGSAIYFHENDQFILKPFGIELNRFKKFLQEIDDTILSAISTRDNIITIQNRKMVPDWIIHDEIEGVVIKEGKLYDLLETDPLLPNLWIKPEGIEKFNTVIQKYADIISYRNWGLHDDRYSLELFSCDASKGKAMNYLANLYDVSATISFGDQWNDISMIEAATYGVAMKNAIPLLKQGRKYITRKDCNHNGVVDFLKKHKLY